MPAQNNISFPNRCTPRMETSIWLCMPNPTPRRAKYQVQESIYAMKGISDDAVDINISAPPKDGEANNELIEMLSQAL